MTAYTDVENSLSGGRPIEVYKFIGTFRNYLYTSHDSPVTVNGENYQPIAIKRATMKVGTQADDTLTFDINMAYNEDVVKDYAFTSSPPDLDLELRRTHEGLDLATDWVLIAIGPVTSFQVDEREATLRVASAFVNALAQPVPGRVWQTPCNHVLYDARCTIDPAGFTTSTTVTGISADGTVHVGSTGGIIDFLAAGQMVNTRTGERRQVVSNNALTDVIINFPFKDLVVGDTVHLIAGCDHSLLVCINKFANVINFGGHPYLPENNPFFGNL